MLIIWFNPNLGIHYFKKYNHYYHSNLYIGFKNSYNHEIVQILIISNHSTLLNVKDYNDYYIKSNVVSPKFKNVIKSKIIDFIYKL